MTNRHKTNSITHLVKIVAEEVVEELVNAELQEHCDQSHKVLTIGSTLNRMGESWDTFEEAELLNSYNEFWDSMKNRHGRTTNALKIRLDTLSGIDV